MNSFLNKIQFKDHKNVLILNSPAEIEFQKSAFMDISEIHESIKSDISYDFVMVFVNTCAEINIIINKVEKILDTDAVLWFVYPKKSSKRYVSDISRDSGWQPLGDAGFEAVRQIAIDADWSALRFRKAEFIKSFKRDKSRAMSEAGKKRQS